jgi:hypothetical protein
MFCDGRADHLIYGAERIDAAVVTAEKLLREVYFGVDKYVGRFGVETYEFDLTGGGSLRNALECLEEFMTMLKARPEVSAEILHMAAELAENALYSAPRDETGRRRYRPSDRQHGVEVDPWEQARLSYAFDGRRILLSVTDWFGSLVPTRVRNTLRSGPAQRTNTGRPQRATTAPGGRRANNQRSGRGLRQVWERSSELVFNISPGKQTEVIAIRELGSQPTRCGLHLHYQGDLRRHLTATPNTIKVSDSMLVDIRQLIAKRKAPPVVMLEPKAANTRKWEDTLTDPQGKVLVADDSPLGVDTIKGLLHGSTSLQRSLEIGLRFLTVCYQGAIAYAVRGETLKPLIAAGEVGNWPELRALDIHLYDDCRLADLARTASSGRYKPSSAYRLDKLLTALTVGEGDAGGYIITVEITGHPRFVLFGFGRKYGRHLANKVAAPFHIKLTESVAKHLGMCVVATLAPAQRRQSTGS